MNRAIAVVGTGGRGDQATIRLFLGTPNGRDDRMSERPGDTGIAFLEVPDFLSSWAGS
jgi:hypothetical protein